MAYFTGSISTPAAMKSLIETQATSAGWTLTGSDVLHKDNSFIKLTAVDTQRLNINAYNAADMSGPAATARSIFLPTAAQPAVYHLFIHDSPATIVFVIVYNVNLIQMLVATELTKIHSSAYVGGNLFFASFEPDQSNIDSSRVGITLNTLSSYFTNFPPTGGTNLIPFTDNGTTFPGPDQDQIHVEIDGDVWATQAKVTYTDGTISALYRSPNTWNSQTHLTTMNLQYAMQDSLYGYLGYIEHIRLVRIDNYEIGDIITIAPDEWKVFPWHKKDASVRNGGTDGHSGTIGFAVRYN